MLLNRRKTLLAHDRPHQKFLDSMFTPIAVGQVLAAAETLTLKGIFDDDGYLRGISSRDARPGSLKHRLCTALDHPRVPKLLAAATLAASAGLLAARGNRSAQIAASAVIGACNRLSEIRTPYGRDGADQMTAVITQYRVLTAAVSDPAKADDLFLRAVNFQSALSYAVSGISKATGSSWVQGDALFDILQSESYGRGPAAALLRDHPRLCRALSISTIVWEASFPLIYLIPQRRAEQALLAVKGFHLGVAAVMELPRFVWGFAGSHGAVRFVLQSRGTSSGLERRVTALAGTAIAVSAILARESQAVAKARRLGPKGVQQLSTEDGIIEFLVEEQTGGREGNSGVTFVLESGLGQSLESWSWLADQLSQDGRVVRYHRSGYGLTTSTASSALAVDRILKQVGGDGPVVVISHSIGSLHAATYVAEGALAERIGTLVIVDGTDPELLEADRTDRRKLGKFLQIQVHTLLAAVAGFYKWAPNTVARQAAYPPDDQFSHVQFAFSPRNIVSSIKEYRQVDTEEALRRLKAASSVLVIASDENAQQQAAFAKKIGAEFVMVEGSAHRSILGFRHHSNRVADEVRRFANVS